jgi:hypothetical protein
MGVGVRWEFVYVCVLAYYDDGHTVTRDITW